MRGSIVGFLAGGVVFACSAPSRDFKHQPSVGGAGGAGGVTTEGSSGSSGMPAAGTATTGGTSGRPSKPDRDCTDTEYDDGTSCQKLTECSEAEYEKEPPATERDRVCAPLTVCGAGSWVSTQPSSDGDRACSACATGTFSSVLNAVACAPWAQCKSGETESVPPSSTSDRVCSKCGAGKYEVNDACQPLTVCAASEYESTPATAVSDRKCSPLTACQPGSRQTAAPTATTDRQCAACSSGTFSAQVNASTCKAWTVCTSTQAQTMAGSSTTDVVCTDCGTATDRACTAQCPCPSAIGVCTANNQCVSGATCVAGSGKKVGRTGNTCLASHCNNDQLDSGETSVDCGGECGCRATFEVVGFKNLAAGSSFSSVQAMSRDGKRLAGYIGRGQSSYPAAVAYDGTVTELESYGKGGQISAASSDGSTLVGMILCANPPSCTQGSTTNVQWSGSAAPKVLDAPGATIRGMSATGTILVGDFYDTATGVQSGILFNGNQRTTIADLRTVAGVTPDGKYVAGALQNGVQGGLWLAQTQTTTKFGDATWTSISVTGVNGTTDPAVVGFGYISSSDSYIGFRWKGGTLSQLGALVAGAYSTPNAVSSDGTAVGVTGTNAFQQAFIWTDKDKLRTIVDELRARGLEPAIDLQLTTANFISDDGKTIVGIQYTQPLTFWRAVLD